MRKQKRELRVPLGEGIRSIGGPLASIIERVGAGLVILDRNMRIVWHNAAALSNFGVEKLKGEFCFKGLHGRETPCEECLARQVFDTGQPTAGTHSHTGPDGVFRQFNFAVAPIFDKHGEVAHVLQIAVDITATRMAEAELARFKRLIDTSDDFMALIDSDRNLLMVNHKVLDELGYTEAELIGKPVRSLIAAPDQEKAIAIRESAGAFGVAIDSMSLLKKDGSSVPVHASAAYDKETGIYACVGKDMSERLSMEEDLRDQHEKVLEAMREKNHFFRSVSHELRTPLTSIIGFAELLLEDTDDPLTPLQQAQLKRVVGNAHKLLGMVNDILDISKIEAGKMRVERDLVRVDEVLLQVVGNMAPLAAEKNLAIDVHVTGNLPSITTDEQKLGQIIVNLVSNAIKFTDRGGITVSASRDGGNIAVSVRDTGIGIAESELGEIFREFHQVHRKGPGERGTGLGLAIARRLARLLGGDIAVESKVGEGSTFTVTLPIRPKTSRR